MPFQAHWVVLLDQRFQKSSHIQQQDSGVVQHQGVVYLYRMFLLTNLTLPPSLSRSIRELLCCAYMRLMSRAKIQIEMVRMASHSQLTYLPSSLPGFSAGGTDILFENNSVQNGDDCLTVGNGAKNIHWR